MELKIKCKVGFSFLFVCFFPLFKLAPFQAPIKYFYSEFLPFPSISHRYLTFRYLPLQNEGGLVYPSNSRAQWKLNCIQNKRNTPQTSIKQIFTFLC